MSIIIEDLSIIIPAYNEEKRLPPTLRRVVNYFSDTPVDLEVLVVNDGSSDRTTSTVNAMEYPQVTVIEHQENKGKFAAIRTGIESASKQWVLIYDADGATPIAELEKFMPYLGDNICIIGSRAVEGSSCTKPQPGWRQYGGRLGNALIRRFSGLPYKDTQCGFKLLSAPLAKKIAAEMEIERFAGDVELLMLARRHGATIREVGIEWHDVPVSTVRITDFPKTLIDLLRIRNKYS